MVLGMFNTIFKNDTIDFDIKHFYQLYNYL